MLVPLTRKKFEQLIPFIATAAQYKYCWGNAAEFLKRVLISLVSVLLLYLITSLLGEAFAPIILLVGIVSGMYWLWGPVLWASLRNIECRSSRYSAFWRGQVLDVYVSEELVGTEETVNKRGELMIVQNRERRLTLEVGDENGFLTKLQVPLRRSHQAIVTGELAEMVVMSNRPDMSRISKVTDIYLPELDVWVSDYPYLRRDVFIDMSSRLENDPESEQTQRKKKRSTKQEPRSGSTKTRRSQRRNDDW